MRSQIQLERYAPDARHLSNTLSQHLELFQGPRDDRLHLSATSGHADAERSVVSESNGPLHPAVRFFDGPLRDRHEPKLGDFVVQQWHVCTRSSVGKAIQLLPRLIILDYMMPQLDGLQTCLRLREEPGLRNAIVVLLSARSEWEVVRAAFKNGANEYIAKPISPVLFVNKVKHLLAS